MTRTEARTPASIDTDDTAPSVAACVPADPRIDSAPARPQQLVWRTERGGLLAAESRGVKLVVLKRSGRDDTVRFLVLRIPSGRGNPFVLMGCGVESNVRRAMAVAEEEGRRLAGLDPVIVASGTTR